MQIPFAATQSPLCGHALSYALTDDLGMAAPAWIYLPVANTHLEAVPNALGLVGSYTFELTATEPITATQSPATSTVVTLAHPCETTTVSAVGIPD